MPDLFDTHPPAPLRPWEYLRLRRLAAGLTIAQAARPHWHRPEHQDDVERNWRTFEQPGVTIRADYLVRDLGRAFPFDADIYLTLRDCPARQHPVLCRGCGSSKWDPLTNRDGTEATIGDDLVCTACAERHEDTRADALRRAA